MNVVFVSPHFPPNMYLYCVRLREAGATVLGIGDAPFDDLRIELRDALAEYYRVPNLEDERELIRALGYLTWRHGKVDRLDSLNEHWLETEAWLRTEFNIHGLRTDDMEPIKRKSAMKQRFRSAGIPVARGEVIASASDAHSFVREVGFPVIAKPDVGVGASRTWRIEDEHQLDTWLAQPREVDYLMEEWLEGRLLSYDGLVDRDGRVVFEVSLVYGVPVLNAVQGEDMYFWIDRALAPDLAQLGRRTVRAFGVRERPFHFEFFRLPDTSLVAVEVNMRPPGGIVVDMWNWAYEIDVYRAWAEVITSGTTTVDTSRPYYCFWAGRRSGAHYHLDDQAVRDRLGSMLVHVEQVRDVFAAAMGNIGYVMRDVDLELLIEANKAIQAPAIGASVAAPGDR
jgi:hypothetical protein